MGLILGGLCEKIGLFGSRHVYAAPLMLMTWIKLRRLNQRFASLLARFHAGRLAAPRSRPDTRTTRQSTRRLPRRAGWLGALGWEFRAHAAPLQHLLDHDPQMAALLTGAPVQAGRILRPLCRMLGLRMPDIAPGAGPPPQPAPLPTPAPSSKPAQGSRIAPEPSCRPTFEPVPAGLPTGQM